MRKMVHYKTTGYMRQASWGGGSSVRKAFLIFLLIACLAATVWAGYLLFTNRTDPVVGTIIFGANIGVLIWNISVLRKWRVGARTIVAIAMVITFLGATTGAFAGVKPFSDAKDKLTGYFPASSSEPSRTVWVENITVGPRMPSLSFPSI